VPNLYQHCTIMVCLLGASSLSTSYASFSF